MDVNVGRRVAEALAAMGHDVVRAALTDPYGEDGRILARAAVEERILITCDRDFSELVFHRAAETPLAIIYVRYRSRDVEDVIVRLRSLLADGFPMHHMVVIDERRVRSTPFPTGSNDNG